MQIFFHTFRKNVAKIVNKFTEIVGIIAKASYLCVWMGLNMRSQVAFVGKCFVASQKVAFEWFLA